MAKHAGIDYRDFWNMTFPEFWWAVEAAQLQQEKSMMNTRLIYSIIYNANAPKGRKKTAEELIPLPSDSRVVKKKIKQLSFDEFKQLLERRKIPIPNGHNS